HLEVSDDIVSGQQPSVRVDNSDDAQSESDDHDDRSDFPDDIHKRVQPKHHGDNDQGGQTESSDPRWQIVMFLKYGPGACHHDGKRQEHKKNREIVKEFSDVFAGIVLKDSGGLVELFTLSYGKEL